MKINEKLIKDYVIEIGTKSNWNYRKWKSGRIELTGTFRYTGMNLTTASMGTYYSNNNTGTKTTSLPFTLSEVEFIGYSEGSRDSGVWCYTASISGSTLSSQYRAHASASNASCTTTFYIIGKVN